MKSPPRFWTDEEINCLRELWTTEPNTHKICRTLGRGYYSVQLKASELGIKRPRARIANAERAARVIRCLTPTEAAWLAGLFDGEGSMGLYPTSRASVPYHARISIANTYLPVIEYLTDLLGAGFRTHRYQKSNPRAKLGYQWQTNDSALIRNILLQIRPYLRIRHQQADLLLEYIEEWLALPRGTKPLCSDRVYTELKKLNRKGIASETFLASTA